MDKWDERYKTGEGLRWWPNEELVRFISKLYPSRIVAYDGNALDLGCGTGCNLWALYEKGLKCFGVDVSPAAIACAERYLEERLLTVPEKCGVYLEAEDLQSHISGEDEEFYDLVVDCQTIQHLSKEDHVLAYGEIARVLKPGGRFWTMHWREGDAELLYAGRYPELRPWAADELGPLIELAGLTHVETSLASRCKVQDNHVVASHWYVMEWRKP